MLCEKCKKRPAVVHIEQTVNGERTERNLCEECAREEGFYNQISFQDFFQGILNMNPITHIGFKKQDQYAEKAYRCPTCGMTADEFRNMGKLGCADCYAVFKSYLDPALKSIHSSASHRGKVPLRGGGRMLIRKQKDDLRQKLDEAVANEEFEEAARLRDEIKKLDEGSASA